MNKICCRCKRELDSSQFTKRSEANSGLRGECKDCEHKRYRERYAAKRAVIRKRQKEYYATHRGEILARTSKWQKELRINHGEEIRARDRDREAGYKEHRQEYRREHKEDRKTRDLKQKYGISPEEFVLLLKEQDNRCAICRSNDWGGVNKAPVLDHIHGTSIVRGILCSRCNLALGLLGDTYEGLERALKYLGKFKGWIS